MAKSKLSARQRLEIVRQFREPETIAKKVGASPAAVRKWFKAGAVPDKYKTAFNRYTGTVMGQERQRASRSGYELPDDPNLLALPSRRMVRRNPLTGKVEQTESVQFEVSGKKSDRDRAHEWLQWARENGYTVRAVYKVGESGLSIDGERYPAEQLSTTPIDLGTVKDKRFTEWENALYGEKGRHVKKFVILQDEPPPGGRRTAKPRGFRKKKK